MSRIKVNTKAVLRFMYEESFRTKSLILALFLIPAGSLCISTGIPYVVSSVLAKLAQGQLHNPQPFFLAFIALATAGVTFNRAGFLLLLSTQAKTIERIQNNVFQNLLSKSYNFYANHMTGKLVSDATGLQDAFVQFQDVLAINILPFLITMAGGILIVSLNAPLLGLGLLIMTMAVVASAIYASRNRAQLRERRHEAQRQLRGYFADTIINNNAVKTFSNETYEQQEHAGLNATLTKYRIHDWKKVSHDGSNRITVILLLQLGFLALIINMVNQNPSLLAAGIFSFAFTITLSNRLFEVSNMIRVLENAVINASSMVDIMNEEPEILDAKGAKVLSVRGGVIEFADVRFRYGDAKEADILFDKLNLRINSGEKVGLVGHSGGGKTTITKLLLRFNDIQGGEILIDGQNIAKVTQDSLRQNIAYVPQEPLLFHRSLAVNISYGKLDATPAHVAEVAKKAHAHEFIEKLPEGYETLVGERGVKLSGGQRQRIAIARAMLKNAPILVLDEATSALDSESEKYIQDALWKLMEGRTAIVIAHRLSTIQKMDRILVMDNGRLVEEGTHKELLRKNGTYASLWAHQSGGFLEE